MVQKWQLATPRPGAHWSPRGFYVWAEWDQPNAAIYALWGPEDHGYEWHATPFKVADAYQNRHVAAKLIAEHT
jgi:hypothetical protein